MWANWEQATNGKVNYCGWDPMDGCMNKLCVWQGDGIYDGCAHAKYCVWVHRANTLFWDQLVQFTQCRSIPQACVGSRTESPRYWKKELVRIKKERNGYLDRFQKTSQECCIDKYRMGAHKLGHANCIGLLPETGRWAHGLRDSN